MTITQNTCASFSVTSSYLTNTNTSSILEVHSCTGLIKSFTQNVSTTLISITATDLFGQLTLKDGPLKFVLKVTQANGSLVEENKCWFVDCAFSCAALAKLTSSDADTILKLNILSLMNNCNSCDCSAMCEIYENISTTINSTDNTNGCCN